MASNASNGSMSCCHHVTKSTSPDSKVHGANMEPIWGRQDPGGPHVGPMNFAIWGSIARATVRVFQIWKNKWRNFAQCYWYDEWGGTHQYKYYNITAVDNTHSSDPKCRLGIGLETVTAVARWESASGMQAGYAAPIFYFWLSKVLANERKRYT